MLASVVVALVGAGDAVVVRIMAGACVIEMMAIAVIGHEGIDVRVVVAEKYGSGMPIVGREVIPVPGGTPDGISDAHQVRVDKGPGVVDRLDDVVGAVEVGRTDDLDTCGLDAGELGYEGGDILIDVVTEDGLDEEDVGPAFEGLEHAEVIHVSVTVEVEVGQHVAGVVEQAFELLYRIGLCEGCAYRLEVQVEGDIVVCCIDAGGGGRRVRSRHGDDGAVCGAAAVIRRDGDDTCETAGGENHRQDSQKGK